jgi:hypothetical protein
MEFILGVILASAVFFAWSAISWMALPWQRGVFKTFANEDAMVEILAAQAPGSGIFGLPGEPRYPPEATKAQRDAIDRAAFDRIQRGPVVFAVVSRGSFGSFPRLLAIAFLGNVAVSLVFAWMLAQTTGLSYGQRVVFLFLASVAAGLACRVPDWNWHKFPVNHTVVNIASLAVGWLLAGLVLARFVQGRP